jgi:hypothetical protein
MDDNAFPEPLFILGSPRSFTSLVCAMIGQHPEIYGVPELNLFVADTLEEFVDTFGGYRQIQQHGLLRTVAQLYAGEQNILSIDMARRWMMRRLAWNISDIYKELCRKVAPLRIADKSPVYGSSVDTLKRIQDTFPNAYYLHLLRHPVTQGQSILNIAKGMMAVMADSIDYSTDPPTVDPQIMWFEMQKNILEFLQHIPEDHKMTMRGEDFLNERDANLRKICKWLDIADDEAAMEAMQHPEDSPYACLGPFGAHLGNDLNFLESPGLRPVKINTPELNVPLPWRPDGKPLQDKVIKLAQQFGYS